MIPLSALLVLAGCDAVATDADVAGIETAPAAVASVAPDTRSASGSGHLTVDGEFRTFTFHARDRAGATSGQFNLISRHTDSHLRGDVACVRFDGDRAFVAGFVTRSNIESFGVGHNFAFVVVDNGEGKAAPPDEITLFPNFPAPQLGFPTHESLVELFCSSADPFSLSPAFGDLLEVEAGNVQVR